MTTPQDFIASRRALLAGVTDGPWTVSYGAKRGGYPQRITNGAAVFIAETYGNPDLPAADPEWIADARTSLPVALDALTAVLDLCDAAADMSADHGDADVTICPDVIRAAIARRIGEVQ